jgi:hypothetical protein
MLCCRLPLKPARVSRDCILTTCGMLAYVFILQLLRNLYSSSSLGTFLASVQLGHIYCEATARSDHEATYEAIQFLLVALQRFQRLFGDLLRQLSNTYRLIPANDTRQVRDAAFNYLIESNIVQV